MRSVRIWVFLLTVFCLVYPATGWFNPAVAAEEQEKAPAQEGAPAEGRGEGFQPEPPGEECPATFGPIVTDTAIPLEKGKFAVQPTWSLGFVGANFSPNWRRVSAGGDYYNFGMSLKLTYGLWKDLEVYTVLPYLHHWANRVDSAGPQGERAADFGGLGDIGLTFKYRLVNEDVLLPTVSPLFTVTFPTGHFRHLNPGRLGTDQLGSGSYAFTAGLNVSKWLKPFIFYGNFWYTLATSYKTDGQDASGFPLTVHSHPRDVVTVNLAVEWPFSKRWIALLELYSNWDGGRLVGARANQVSTAKTTLLPGLEFMATEKLSFALGVGIDLVGKNIDLSYTPMFSLVYAF